VSDGKCSLCRYSRGKCQHWRTSATVKSGTNLVHGHLWEYVRNTSLDARDWDSTIVPPYHMNQFGGTLGFPIRKNKLFYFGDIQDTRISFSGVNILTTPTPLMRQGNQRLSEALSAILMQRRPRGLPGVGSRDRPSADEKPLAQRSCRG
jgi:hypothetical protein